MQTANWTDRALVKNGLSSGGGEEKSPPKKPGNIASAHRAIFSAKRKPHDLLASTESGMGKI
jgi:hypothetical protein